MSDTWEVTVTRNGESVVTVGSNHLAGREISDADERVIRIAARSLLGFVGSECTCEIDRYDFHCPRHGSIPISGVRPVTKEPTKADGR